MGSRINDVRRLNKLSKQEAVDHSVGSGVAAYDVSLGINSVGVNVRATRDIHRHATTIVNKRSVTCAIERPVSPNHSSLRVHPTEESVGGALAVYGLIVAAIEHESVQPGVAYVTSHNSASRGYGRKGSRCAGKIDGRETAPT